MNVKINQWLSAVIPDNFKVLTEDELKKIYPNYKPTICGFQDPESSLTFTVFSKKAIPILSAVSDSGSTAKNLEQRTSAVLKNYGYQLEGFFEKEFSSVRAHGFRYSYQDKDKQFVGESLLFQTSKCHFTVHYYAPKAEEPASAAIFEEFLQSFALQA